MSAVASVTRSSTPAIGCSTCAPASWCNVCRPHARISTSVLFELIAERYERRSMLITANQPFSGWDTVFPDPGMTLAAIDRLVHHSTIFELNKVESYRGKQAARQQKVQRDHDKATRPRQSANGIPTP